MKNLPSKYQTATFYICSVFAIFAGLSIETYTLPAANKGVIALCVSLLTLSCLTLLCLKLKNFKHNKIVAAKLIAVKSKKQF